MPSRAELTLVQRRGGLAFCLRFALYTIVIFLLLYALHVPVVVPLTRAIAALATPLIPSIESSPGTRSGYRLSPV